MTDYTGLTQNEFLRTLDTVPAQRQQNDATFTQDITAVLSANTERQIIIPPSKTIVIAEAPTGFELALGDSRSRMSVRQGDKFSSEKATRLTLESTVDQTVTIRVSNADLSVAERNENTVATKISSLSDATVGASSSAIISAADANKKTVIVSVPSTATLACRFGDSSVNASNGFPVAPGGALTLDGTYAVYCYNPNTGSVLISRLETMVA